MALIKEPYINQTLLSCQPHRRFVDAAKAKEVAAAMIQQGADIIAHDADAAGLELLKQQLRPIPELRCYFDQYELALIIW